MHDGLRWQPHNSPYGPIRGPLGLLGQLGDDFGQVVPLRGHTGILGKAAGSTCAPDNSLPKSRQQLTLEREAEYRLAL
jgi:hypothetical protein